ncbi:hypothetical protein Tco_0920205 [Tanacetum coccineum]
MASLDHRLNPIFSIKECMTCGALYTTDFCCSKGGLEDKILVLNPPQNCPTCGNPVDGLYCRPCAFVRKCLNEDWYTIHDENEILNTSESSNHNTNIVSALREPFVFNQDPGVNSSQNPLQSNHNCCYKCGDSLDDIFSQRCTCKSCGNGAHIGYNCPPKALIISNPEQCNQTINEFPQTFPSVHPTCNSGDENSFTYNSKPNFVDNSPNVFNHSCEFCGNDARYGHYCTPQVSSIYPELCYNQDFNFQQDFHDFQQQYLCCENCGGPHETFQCQPMNEDYYEQNSCYDPNSFGFDQYQPPQFPVNYPPQETSKEILQAREDLMEAIQAFLKEYDHIPPNEKCMALLLAEERFLKIKQAMEEEQDQPEVMQELLLKLMNDLQILKGIQQEKKETAAQSCTPYWDVSMIDDEKSRDNFLEDVYTFLRKFSQDIQELISELLEDVRNIEEELPEYINCPSWNRPLFFDYDDDDYTIIYCKPKAITPVLPIEEPDNSLSMGDKHLDTILRIENLVPIPSEFEGISDETCDVPVRDDSSTFDVLNDHSEILSLLKHAEITPDLPIKEPDNSLIIGDEYLDTIPSVEELIIVNSNDDDTSSDNDDFEDIEYVEESPPDLEIVILEEVNDVDQEKEEFDLENILQIQDIFLGRKLFDHHSLIAIIGS